MRSPICSFSMCLNNSKDIVAKFSTKVPKVGVGVGAVLVDVWTPTTIFNQDGRSENYFGVTSPIL